MNREEAMEALRKMGHSYAPHASEILDAIGFDQMQGLLDWRGREIASLTDVVIRLGRERDAARALADQLAEGLRDCKQHADTTTTDEPVWALPNKVAHTVANKLAAYEAREWK